jgi:hypothetical protein
VSGDVAFTLDGQLRDQFDQCHMTLNVFAVPAIAASPARAGSSQTLPSLFGR